MSKHDWWKSEHYTHLLHPSWGPKNSRTRIQTMANIHILFNLFLPHIKHVHAMIHQEIHTIRLEPRQMTPKHRSRPSLANQKNMTTQVLHLLPLPNTQLCLEHLTHSHGEVTEVIHKVDHQQVPIELHQTPTTLVASEQP